MLGLVVASATPSPSLAQLDVEQVCNDSIDNDGDGLTDAADLDCSFEYLCQDGVDNDLDGNTDGADTDCTCVDTATQDTNNCTANDVQFVLLGLGTQTDGCVTPDDMVTVFLRGTLEAQSAGNNTRRDIGLWVALGDTSAKTGAVCARQSLQPAITFGMTPTAMDLLNGRGPFVNVDNDVCGDITGNSDPAAPETFDAMYQYPVPITLTCRDALTADGSTSGASGADGFLDLPSCSSWKQASDNNDMCAGTQDALPGTKAKCRCEDATHTDVPAPDLMCGTPSGASAIGTEGVITCADQGDVAGASVAGDGVLSPGESAICTVRYRNDATCTPDTSTAERFRCGTAGYVRYKISYDTTFGSLESAAASGNDLVDTSTSGSVVWTPVSPTGSTTGDGVVGPGQFEDLTFTYRASASNTSVQSVNFQMTTFWANDQTFSPEVDQSPSVMCSATLTTTPVTLGQFTARTQSGSTVVEWTTATEAGNLGFDLYAKTRGGWQRVNDDIIPSQAQSPSTPTTYRFDVGDVEATQFRIEDIDLRGERRSHGPFRVERSYGDRPQTQSIDWQAVRNVNQRNGGSSGAGVLPQGLQLDFAQTGGNANGGNPNLPPALDLKVSTTGVQRLTYDDLLAAGYDFSKVKGSDLALSSPEGGVPLRVVAGQWFGPGSYLEFWGEALDTFYTDTNVYRLTIDKKSALRIGEDASAAGAGAAPSSYLATTTVERNRMYTPHTPGPDPWIDSLMMAFGRARSYSLPLELPPGALSGGEVVHVDLWGVTDMVQSPDHHVRVYANGALVADRLFEGASHLAIDASASGLLSSGANTLTVELPSDTGALGDVIALESYGATYYRSPQAIDGALRLETASDVVEVGGLPSPDVVAYRLDGAGPVFLAGAQSAADGAGGYTVRVPGDGRGAELVVADAASLATPVVAASRVPGELISGEAKYLVISHPLFLDGLAPLLASRAASGLSTALVNVEDVYAKYSGGVFDAEAIRELIADAVAQHGTEMVLLVGGDTYDYRGFLGNGSISFIPSLYAVTDPFVRHAPVDPLYGELDGDGIPDVAVGRFPVRTPDELAYLVDKTLTYEGNGYARTALLVADKLDRTAGLSFKDESQRFFDGLGNGWQAQTAFLDDDSVSATRQKLVDGVDSGVALTSFVGHSGPTVWTFSGLFRSSDAATLANDGQPTVVVQWGCWTNYYVEPAYNTLGHQWLVAGYQGAAAVLGATSLVEDSSSRALSTYLAPKLGQRGLTLGEALIEAKQRLSREVGGLADVQLGWTLLGDPALVLEP